MNLGHRRASNEIKYIRSINWGSCNYFYSNIFIFWISKCLRDIAKQKSPTDHNNPSDIDCIKSLIDRLGMEELCERLIKAQDILDNSTNLHLDRKQILYSVILTVAD